MVPRTPSRWLLSAGITLALVALMWAIDGALAQGPAPQGPPPPSELPSRITYQGLLKEAGAPVTGSRDMIFRLYSDVACELAHQLGPDIAVAGVSVSKGYFTVYLDVDPGLFDGRVLWLGVQVGSSTLPCQQVVPAPYALGLRPEATINGPLAGHGEADVFGVLNVNLNGYYYNGKALRAQTSATGTAVYGSSPTGVGVAGSTEDGYAVYGKDTGTLVGRGYGGYFESGNGTGARGQSMSGFPGLQGVSQSGRGVFGESASGTGVFGLSRAAAGGEGVYGYVASGSAVYGTSPGLYGIHGLSADGYAVYGESAGHAQGYGYGGYFESSTGVGAFGKSTALRSGDNRYAPGVYGRSQNGVGVYGVSDSATSTIAGVRGEGYGGPGVVGQGYSTYGGYFTSQTSRALYARGDSGDLDAYFDGDAGIQVQADAWIGRDARIGRDLYVTGNSYFTGPKTGYVADIALNDGPDALALGDVVAISGVAEPVLGRIPVPRVRKAASASSTGVMGVVANMLAIQSTAQSAEGTDRGPAVQFVNVSSSGEIAPGQFVGVVTLGAFEAIKVDASFGAVKPGDLLVSSPNPGYAMRSDDPKVGTVIGKALGELASGTGSIPVLITLQ